MKISSLKLIKTVAFILLLGSLHSGNGYAQWVFESVVEPMYTVHFMNQRTGWVYGNGIYYKTTNGGLNWGYPSIMNTPLTSYVTGKFFYLDSLYGFASNGSESIILTSTGGNTWITKEVYPVEVTDVCFANRTTGWAIANETNCPYPTVYKTTNFGLNWVSQSVTGYEKRPMSSIFVSDTNYVCIGMDSGKVARTTDGGNTWTVLDLSTIKEVSLIYFINRNNGWIWLNPGSIAVTTNAGAYWTMYTMPYAYDNVKQAVFEDSLSGWVITDYRHLLRTTNGGLSWTLKSTGTSGNLDYLCFKDLNSGWITTSSGQIIETTNGGNNWFTQNNPVSAKFNSVFFNDAVTGWIVSDNGLILKTTDGGIDWASVPNPGSGNLTHIFFINDMTGWVSCSGGMILKTTNRGGNWNMIQIANLPSNSMCFIDELHGWLAGNNGSISSTSDGAASWINLPQFTSRNFNSIDFVNPNTGYVCGDSGAAFKTTNLGVNWVSISPASSDYYNSVSFVNSNVGILAGNYQYYQYPYYEITRRRIYRTTDGGASWSVAFESSSTGYYSPLNSVSVFNKQNFCATSQGGGGIYVSADTGKSWSGNLAPYLSGINYYGSFFLNSQKVWVVGDNGAIVTSDYTPIGISEISRVIPSKFNLHQNYPNPFNPSTKIKFDIPKWSNAKLIIYDVLGRQVATLVNEQLKPGGYEVEWEGSNYASGIYFYQLVSEQFTETKRMVLIK